MTPETVENDFLQTVVIPELQAEGYGVYLYPKRPRLPAFFGNFVPDAIAFGERTWPWRFFVGLRPHQRS
jgi:hypothetical protein